MFTGLITGIGTVTEREERGDTRFRVQTAWAEDTFELGQSIMCSGACMTVVAFKDGWFDFEASAESLDATTLSTWQHGTRINLERSLTAGAELGGHIVTGHVDAVAEVLAITPDGDSHRVEISMPPDLAPMLAQKGSITVDGTSLTVNAVIDAENSKFASGHFGINIIPHTWTHTIFQDYGVGTKVNLEVDILARYVARQLAFKV